MNGFVAMELARVDASVATFWGVHTGLSAGSIYLCADEEQKQRWLPPMMRFEKIGSFGLTEPLVGSATSGGMMTTCRREGDSGRGYDCCEPAWECPDGAATPRSQD